MKSKNNLWSILNLFGGSENEQATSESLDENPTELYNSCEKLEDNNPYSEDDNKELEE